MFRLLYECLMKDIHPDTVLKSLYVIRTEAVGSKYRDAFRYFKTAANFRI